MRPVFASSRKKLRMPLDKLTAMGVPGMRRFCRHCLDYVCDHARRDHLGSADRTFAFTVRPRLSRYRAAQEIDRVGCIVLSDLSTPCNIHPPNKLKAGERYAAWALNKVYGRKVLPGGPRPVSTRYEKRNARVVVRFEDVGEGLRTLDGCSLVRWSEVGDDSGILTDGLPFWSGADAEASPDGKEVWLDMRSANCWRFRPPRRVRHAWMSFAMPNLSNSAEYPASCFQMPITSESVAPTSPG